MKLAEKGVIVLAEPIDKKKNLYRVYCPKCRTWHTAYLSGLPENEHFHLLCGEVLFYIASLNIKYETNELKSFAEAQW